MQEKSCTLKQPLQNCDINVHFSVTIVTYWVMYSGRLKAEKEVKSRNKEAKEQTVIKEDGHREFLRKQVIHQPALGKQNTEN